MSNALELDMDAPFAPADDAGTGDERVYHSLGAKGLCDTDSVGHAQPARRSATELVIDAPAGFVPLWAPNSTLMWRFQERSFARFRSPSAAKARVRALFAAGVGEWGDAVPVRFSERSHGVDFEIVVSPGNKCTPWGCVLASAFFPDSGQHSLVLYPSLFDQSEREQVETMAHELGHVFGLRHFFAKVKEPHRESVLFGRQDSFTIMNYGPKSTMTDADRDDLKRLYDEVWSGRRRDVNGTPVQQVVPYSTLEHYHHGGVTYQST